MSWAFLTVAILSEVSATLGLRMASTPAAPGRSRSRWWYAMVAVGYVIAFAALALTLRHGMGIGVAYGIWSAVGVALTALASKVLFGEPLTRTMVAGMGLIMAGVLLIELGSGH